MLGSIVLKNRPAAADVRVGIILVATEAVVTGAVFWLLSKEAIGEGSTGHGKTSVL